MKEIPIQSARARAPQVCLDATALIHTGSYELRVSPEQGGVFISTDSYHPGILFLSREDLKELLAGLPTQ